MQVDGLEEIILVGYQRIWIEHNIRKGNEWVIQPLLLSLGQTLTLPTVEVSVPLADINDGVQLPLPKA